MASTRRLPVYLLLDTSGSMRGEPIEQVKSGVQMLINTLRSDPFALETVHLCIVTFDREAREVVPLTSICEPIDPKIECPASGPTNLGKGLQLILHLIDRDVCILAPHKTGNDWCPLLLIVTDGSPSDSQVFEQIVPQVLLREFATIAVLATGPRADTECLKRLAGDNVFDLTATDPGAISAMFRWVDFIELPARSPRWCFITKITRLLKVRCPLRV